MEWYITARQLNLKISELQRLEELSTAMMEMMVQIFPNRDGTARGWKLGKFHAVVHTVLTIVMFGWTENTSGQWGERAHVDLMKSMARLTNNKDIFRQFLSWHERSSHIQRLFQAQSHEVVDSEKRCLSLPVSLRMDIPSCSQLFASKRLFKKIHLMGRGLWGDIRLTFGAYLPIDSISHGM